MTQAGPGWRLRCCILVLTFASVAGCLDEAARKVQASIERQASEDDGGKLGTELMSAILEHDEARVRSLMAPKALEEAPPDTLQQVFSLVPLTQDRELKVIGFRWFEKRPFGDAPPERRVDLTYQARAGTKYLMGMARVERVEGVLKATAFHVAPVAGPLDKLHAFSLEHASALHYLALLLAVALPCFCAVCLVLCWRTPIPARKWLWLAYVGVGIGVFKLNWTTSQVEFAPLSFQLLGYGFTRASSYAPLIMSFGVPVGGLHFLRKRRSWLKARSQDSSSSASP